MSYNLSIVFLTLAKDVAPVFYPRARGIVYTGVDLFVDPADLLHS